MTIWHSMGGMVSVELTAPDPAAALSCVSNARIHVSDVMPEGDLTVRMSIRRADRAKLMSIARKKGFEVRYIKKEGVFWSAASLLHRPVFAAGVMIAVLAALMLPNRVLFVQVEGNVLVPEKRIIEAAELHGVCFGATRRDVRSERIKNALLEEIPQLQWVGVNTKGCVAVISVRERSIPQYSAASGRVGSIVAVRDGVVVSCVVEKGNKLCDIGQAVTAGQVLISGYTDNGLSVSATCASGENYANTKRILTVTAPSDLRCRGAMIDSGKRISVILGKKRINFYKGSGISTPECVRMYKESYVTLPGGFRLPIRIGVEQWFTFATTDISAPADELEQQLRAYATAYLNSSMIAGKILSSEIAINEADSTLILSGNYDCLEMIGQLRNEEIIKPNGNDS